MREAILEPSVIYSRDGISRFEKGEQLQQSFSLLCTTWNAKLKPDVISYSAGICAGRKSDQRQRSGRRGGETGARRCQLQSWDSGSDLAEEDVGGEVEAEQPQLQRWHWCVCENANRGSGLRRCPARCKICIWGARIISPTWPAEACARISPGLTCTKSPLDGATTGPNRSGRSQRRV
ncbi:unnamed protein product [Prorocentrum cordatum]|uniref:Uncharacterized protein n=1 Tax=Prorocentrum cordatum TaxID=2364126 RepID=A0ABN9W4C0_9DINO|nr:unnamed protein product [Polarella glacialis]